MNKINIKIKLYAVCLMMAMGKNTDGQNISDTVMANEFSRVMSFAAQPYLFFNTVTTMNAVPVIQEQDTMSFNGIFYKCQADLYYSNGREELFLQDSLMIQINQNRKTIWISKIDIASKQKINVLPVDSSQLQELFSKQYTIQKIKVNNMISRLNFVTKKKPDSSTTTTTSIGLQYQDKNYLPLLMEIQMRMQQPASDELISELKNEDIDDTKLVQVIGNIKYLVRMQNITVVFNDINNTKEKAMKMPSWKDILDYRETQHDFIAKGLYKDYEVTKTF